MASRSLSRRRRYCRRVLSARSPPSAGDDHGAKQQRLHARGEDGITGLDGELAVPQLMGEADLPGVGMALLGAVEVRDPNGGAMAVHHLGDDGRRPALADDVDDHGVVLEHPVPAGLAVDAHPGFVRTHHARAAQAGEDGADFAVEARLGTAEHGVQRPFADRQPEQVFKKAAQALVADGMDEAQVDRHGQDAGTERRTVLHAFRHRRQRRPAAAWAVPGVALHPGHHRAHRRQVDLVVAPMQGVIAVIQRRAAMDTGRRLGDDELIGIGCQWAPAALPAQAALARPLPFDLVRTVGLLPLRRRHTRIARRLRRLIQFGLQLRHPRRQHRDLLRLRPQRDDQRILLCVRKPGKVGQWRQRSHPQVESNLPPLVNTLCNCPSRGPTSRTVGGGLSSYR